DGEVKKKGEDKTSKFHEVFLRAAGTDHNNPHGLVAVTRGPDGAIAVHDVDQFKALISGGIGSYVAVQRFMPMRGGDGSLYRTTYEVVNDTGHTVCTTAKLTKVLTPEKAESK
ncbi:RR2, partial [Symbiodinium sp. KB8]